MPTDEDYLLQPVLTNKSKLFFCSRQANAKNRYIWRGPNEKKELLLMTTGSTSILL